MGGQTWHFNVGLPGKTVYRRSILALKRYELDMFMRLTRSTIIPTFRQYYSVSSLRADQQYKSIYSYKMQRTSVLIYEQLTIRDMSEQVQKA